MMKPHIYSFIALSLAQLLIIPVHAQTDPGLQAIIDLSKVNGQALACQDMSAATRAKSLMLLHAPRTARFGAAFEEGTHQAFLEQTRGDTPCPDSTALSARLVTIALQLQASLPAVAPFTPNPASAQ
jgi:hypothetical protein